MTPNVKKPVGSRPIIDSSQLVIDDFLAQKPCCDEVMRKLTFRY